MHSPEKTTLGSVPVICAAVCMLGGCESLEERTKYLNGPKAFVWKSAGDPFGIQGTDDMYGQLNIVDDDLSFYVVGFPPGTKIVVAGQEGTVDAEGRLKIEGDVTSWLGGVGLDELQQAELEGVTFEVTPVGGATFEVPVPRYTVYGVENVLTKLANGPVLFDGESPDQGGRIANVLWLSTTITREVVGRPAKTLAELDAVAFTEQKPVGTRTCTGYVDESGKPQPDVTLELVEATITIRNRRSGEQVATRTFPPLNECPGYLLEDKTSTLLPEKDIKAWFQAVFAGKPDAGPEGREAAGE